LAGKEPGSPCELGGEAAQILPSSYAMCGDKPVIQAISFHFPGTIGGKKQKPNDF
jgi:hypothetical protein